MTAQGEPLLRVRDVYVRFDGIVALDGVSFDVRRGEICGLIGPNGAGKTTLFNCLSRLYEPERGTIEFDGRPLRAVRRHDVARIGIGRTFQNLALFASMTVRENILAGGHSRARGGFVADIFRLRSAAREELRLRDRTGHLLAELDLGAVADVPVAALPFATRKRVELARALAGEPRLLLLDEPAGGLEHDEVDHLRERIRALRDRLKLTILLVEHHLGLVMRASDRIVALDFGRTIAEGTPDEMRRHPEVVRSYLGAGQ